MSNLYASKRTSKQATMARGSLKMPGSSSSRRTAKRVHWARLSIDSTVDIEEALPLNPLSPTQEYTNRDPNDDDNDSDSDSDSESDEVVLAKQKQSRKSIRRTSTEGLRSRFTMGLLMTLVPLLIYILHLWSNESRLKVPWKPDVDTILFSQKPLPAPLERTRISNYTLPLRTKGRNIVDAEGRRFKLQSVNWYGGSDELFVPGGLDIQHRNTIAQTIKRLGFNSVRLPYSDELVIKNPIIEPHLVAANPDLASLHALDVFEAVTTALTDAGIAVIINNHITSATWCCNLINPCDATWANDHWKPLCRIKQTEEQWIQHWEAVMERFLHNPFVVGADLRNEVRGLGGTWENWASAAERCGNRLLKMNPDLLIVVEGIDSADDISGAAGRPVELDVADRLVYSAHSYSWFGFGTWEGKYEQRSYKSFKKTMRRNWGYLLDQDIAPVWVGELGAPHEPNVGEIRFWRNLWKYLRAKDADFGYWALNPRKVKHNETEVYGLVKDDWITPIVDYRMKDIVESMRK